MSVYDVLKNQESNVLVTIKREDLMMFGKFLIAEAKKELEAQLKANNEEVYLTKKEVASMLQVDLSTLWLWNKKDYLKPIEVGGKRLYKKSDIDRVLQK